MNRTLARLAGATTVAALALGGLGLDHAGADRPDDEARVTSLVNQERAGRGLGTLAVNGDLAAMTERWTRQMASTGVLEHNPNLAAEAPPGWQFLGENVGVGTSADTLHAAFMASEGHRHNVLESRFAHVYVAAVRGADGRLWVTETFLQPPAPGSTSSYQAAAGGQPAPATARATKVQKPTKARKARKTKKSRRVKRSHGRARRARR